MFGMSAQVIAVVLSDGTLAAAQCSEEDDSNLQSAAASLYQISHSLGSHQECNTMRHIIPALPESAAP